MILQTLAELEALVATGQPPAPRPLPVLPCAHRGEALTGYEREARGLDHRGEWVWCEHEAKPLGEAACACIGCGPACSGYRRDATADAGTVVIDHGGNGIGDALPGLLATGAVKRERPGVRVDYRVSAAALPWVALFDGYDSLGTHFRDHSEEPVPYGHQLNAGYQQEWGSRFAGGSRVQRYLRNVGAREAVLPNLREPERVKALGAAYAGAVFLCPFSLHAGREWPIERWLALERDLRARGVRTVVCHSSADRCDRFAGELAVGFPPDRLAGAFLSASCVVGNDSGPAHLAGILGAPTVVVAGGYPAERIFGEYPRVTCVQSHSLGAVSVEQVAAAVDGMTLDPSALIVDAALRLGERQRSMGWLLGEARDRFPDGPRIVETGCVRAPWDWSAGYATWVLGVFLERLGRGSLATVDIDPAHLATAKNLCRRWSRIEYVQSCSAAYLEARTEPIDVAYLDSLDTYEPGCAEHGLREARAAQRLVSPRGLIVFDDTPPDGKGGWDGKGRLAVPYLIQRGWRVLPASGYQTILEREAAP